VAFCSKLGIYTNIPIFLRIVFSDKMKGEGIWKSSQKDFLQFYGEVFILSKAPKSLHNSSFLLFLESRFLKV